MILCLEEPLNPTKQYGQCVDKDENKAFHYYKMAADHPSKPNAYAQYQLGRMCVDNPEESERWYRLAYQGFLRIEQEMPDDKRGRPYKQYRRTAPMSVVRR